MFMVWPAYVSSGEVFPQRALSASLCDPGGGDSFHLSSHLVSCVCVWRSLFTPLWVYAQEPVVSCWGSDVAAMRRRSCLRGFRRLFASWRAETKRDAGWLSAACQLDALAASGCCRGNSKQGHEADGLRTHTPPPYIQSRCSLISHNERCGHEGDVFGWWKETEVSQEENKHLQRASSLG